ncbi:MULTISPECIES: PilW family protein [Aeromonas]|uniref:PilW family protein n=1 Tax=Aeromonas TaxID=642 RepID=UPI000A408C58|nr:MULTISPECIES: PilW family protein [Aeromonas]MCV3280852.1 PilW family protein [Aeromonas caviae]MDY7839953.1 PilW family protein [Aeromonas caviae]PNO60624.1 pilus assembly protein PilW [Aeromonas caviae]QSO21501.1 PilW family protein [Aeromonas caviae]QXB94359.1 PilW family protein [Aeromonas sp. FDAARGOS 1406]
MISRGFTLVEWLVAMLLGLFLLAGVFTVFVMSRSSSEDAFDQSELQENGRLAIRLISQDIKWAGFFGAYTGQSTQVGSSLSLSAGSIVPASSDCLDERSVGSLPSNAGPIRGLWVSRVSTTKGLAGFACILAADRVENSDVISIKRLVGRPIPASEGLDTNRFYMAANSQEARIIKGSETRPLFGANNESQIWEYQHYIYYLSQEDGVPVLRKRYLTVNGGSALIGGAMAEGVEHMVLMYGVDDSLIPDGRIDRYISTDQMTTQRWNEGRVLGARLFLLIRAARESSRYKNNNSYQLGNITVDGGGDGYRRLLLESSIALRNQQITTRGGT